MEKMEREIARNRAEMQAELDAMEEELQQMQRGADPFASGQPAAAPVPAELDDDDQAQGEEDL